jgi:DNA-binding MarR family transcriptional regulator
MAESPEAEREFVDRMGLVLERLGGSRTMGRICGHLLVCDPPDQSLTDLASALGASKASVSVVARQMETAGMVERVPGGGRSHRYRLVSGGWAQLLQVQLAGVRQGLEVLESGVATVRPVSADAHARLVEARDFFAFSERDGRELVQRWRAYRDRGDGSSDGGGGEA